MFGRPVSIVHSRTQATEYFFFWYVGVSSALLCFWLLQGSLEACAVVPIVIRFCDETAMPRSPCVCVIRFFGPPLRLLLALSWLADGKDSLEELLGKHSSYAPLGNSDTKNTSRQ
jgi:hypothetical protein